MRFLAWRDRSVVGRLLLVATLCATADCAAADRRVDSVDFVDSVETATRALQAARGSADPQVHERAGRQLAALQAHAPDDPLVISLGGWMDMGRHDFASALERAERALARDPAQPIALALRVDALTELGRYDEAVSAAQTLADRAAPLAAYPRIAHLRFLHGDLTGAIELAQQALALAPQGHAEHGWLTGDLARLLVDSGQAQAAVELLQPLRPRTAQTHAWLAQALQAAGNREAATAHWREARALLPLPEYGLALWKLARERHDERETVRLSRQLRAQAKLDAAHGSLARRDFIEFHALDGRPEQAHALALAELQRRPDIFSEAQLSWVLDKMNRPAEAVRFAERARRLGTQSRELAHWLAGLPATDVSAQAGYLP